MLLETVKDTHVVSCKTLLKKKKKLVVKPIFDIYVYILKILSPIQYNHLINKLAGRY